MRPSRLAFAAVLAAMPLAASATPVSADRAMPVAEVAPTPPMRRRPPPPPPPSPTAEISARAQAFVGSWKCKGVTLPGDGSSTPLTQTTTIKLDLGGMWIHATTLNPSTNGQSESFRTFDAVAKQWSQIVVDTGGQRIEMTSPGESKGTWAWTGTTTAQAGTFQVHAFESVSGGTLKLWGETLLGGSWQKTYEISCSK